jgi:polysaccharide deacetylase family protein (PEP-CTERM system associated)
VAEALPELAPRIAAAGHEIASHGWSHSLVSQLTPDQFRQELQRTNALLLAQTGHRPRGFRAPRWSLNWHETAWAFAILVEEGFLYDSSCTPLAGLGDPRGPRTPQRLLTAAGTLWGIPPLVTPALFTNLPTGGGWGFRFFPQHLIERTIGQLNRQGQPAVFFIHPREVDPLGPRLKMPFWREFITYGFRGDAAPRLAYLLKRHTFVPLKDLVASWPVA